MNQRGDVVSNVFRRVLARLIQRSSSLKRFTAAWHGSAGGIEAWLKVEFAAAIPAGVAAIHTGSAAGTQLTGKRYPDLILKSRTLTDVNVELKGSTNWSLTHGRGRPEDCYPGSVLFFLCGVRTGHTDQKRAYLQSLGRPFDIAAVCTNLCSPNGRPVDYLFGYIDLAQGIQGGGQGAV